MKSCFRHKVAGGFLLMAFLCVFVGYRAFITTRNMQKVFRVTMSENVSGLKAAEELELALLNQKGFVANYFIDGDPAWLKMLEDTKADFGNWLNRASDAALTPVEKSLLEDISVLYGAYNSGRDRAIRLYQSGKKQEAKNILLVDMWGTLTALYQKCEEFILVNESIIKESEASLQKKVTGMMFIIWVPAIVIIGLVGSMFYLLVRKILNSVESIAVTARNISLNNLSARVATENLEKEMECLAQSFNQMLERLERSFEYIKEFSSSISHALSKICFS
jgi:methyl-accepting chemotaxis protein